MGDVAREQGAAVADLDGPPETAHPWPDALAVAEQVLADMRGGDLFDVSPDRSARIIAKVIDDARRAGFVRARDIAAEHASFVDDDEGDGSIESIIRAMDPSEANLPSIPQEVTAGIMTVDLGVSETEGDAGLHSVSSCPECVVLVNYQGCAAFPSTFLFAPQGLHSQRCF